MNLEELTELARVVGGESTIKNYNMQITFMRWIVYCPPTIKKTLNQKG
jgi:hypothetical protein